MSPTPEQLQQSSSKLNPLPDIRLLGNMLETLGRSPLEGLLIEPGRGENPFCVHPMFASGERRHQPIALGDKYLEKEYNIQITPNKKVVVSWSPGTQTEYLFEDISSLYINERKEICSRNILFFSTDGGQFPGPFAVRLGQRGLSLLLNLPGTQREYVLEALVRGLQNAGYYYPLD